MPNRSAKRYRQWVRERVGVRLDVPGALTLTEDVMRRGALPGMTGPETRDYLAHHLALVGRTDTIFSDDAADLIHQTSRGLPRAVNNLALQALVATYIADKTIVDESATRTAVAEITAD